MVGNWVSFMASWHSLKQWTVLIFLLACLGNTHSFAAELFAGIDGLQPMPVQGNTQTIQVISDLPFQYQLIPLNTDQVLVRFLNARLSARLQTADGIIPIETGGSMVAHATVRTSETPDIEEVVLIGEGLGRKKVILEGGEEVPVSARELSKYTVPNKSVRTARNSPSFIPSTYPSGVGNYSPYGLVQSGNGIQLPFINPRTKQGNTVEAEEQLPQAPPVRLPRPSFQPEVSGQDFNATPIQTWQQPQEAYEETPVTISEEPALESNPTEAHSFNSTESEIELQQSIQSQASPAISRNSDNTFLRPKAEVEAKPRLELALENSTAGILSTKPAAIQHSNHIQPNSPGITERPQPTHKPTVRFPDDSPISQSSPNLAQIQSEQSISMDRSPLSYQQYTSPKPSTEPVYNTLAYSSPMQLQTTLDQAKAQYAEHRYEAAESTIETALQNNPNDASLYAALGELYIEQHRYPSAQMAYGQAYNISQNTNAIRYAQVLILTQQSQQAISVLQKFLSPKNSQLNSADNGKAHYILGTLLEERGDTGKALPHLQQAAQFLPDDADIQYNLALAYELIGNLAMAKAHYSKATQLNPSAQDARQGLNRVKTSN